MDKNLNIPYFTVNLILRRFKRTRSMEYKSLDSDLRPIIKDYHKQLILNIIDKKISICILCNDLQYIETVTLKRVTAIEEKRNDEMTLRKRHKYILRLQLEEILYSQNCIFINEADFNFYLIKSYIRAKTEKYALA
ncbi:hypothetical protein PHYBLDRAFT_68410 [Phycomyces blakesleeanus NRRL 1555(-)]|uniref:Homeodomain-like DNA binding domain-containing transcription factor n=1 Tax=Phycomyces blakesleeanus (strain ATCC 8743b / DSM 1359 / FGSC 10004 / NBRC 33097 / NRRL 1555) TaxID=763407 RepID=A0A167PJN4_PHYB8|nr:hypothetical protein PHYBLDRAFT_68410 [Phycomyces blakesleeanus NRRL 1555(-)]OAD78087.1 hypothetical protein PHYBLDRAFT_68410 [Phycomyces blakesleeanus NRRL 1555(-)]|eukprot:XP_018296127.1 hypothetical protein PHYBLDRAFT_68410 [Phycomyces blakesleeanus NRRL 1555(-)]